MTRTIVIGDIHGCHDELRDLLDVVGPAADDLVVSVGDLVDRGPAPVEVVRFFRDTPGALAVLGNHEDKHLRSRTGELSPALAQRICREQAGAAYDELLDHFATLPPVLELPDAIVVHAGFEPTLPVADQPRNVLLRGKWPGTRGLGGDPTAWVGRYAGERPVVYGHTTCAEPRVVGRTFGIDTGVHEGGRLTALVLPEERLVSVPARADHWRATRARWGPSCATPLTPALALETPLERLAEPRRSEAVRIRALVDEGLRLLEALLDPLPRPAGPVGKRALGLALVGHPLEADLRAVAFGTDPRTQLARRFSDAAQLEEALLRWRAGISKGG